MTKVLVLGGTRFFGKRLVERLLQDEQCEVTIVTRGLTPDSFGGRITRLEADRTDAGSLSAALGKGEWDVVYDNICFSPNEALEASKILAGRVQKYILTSSLSVYDFNPHALTENMFDPYTYPLQYGDAGDFSYQEGKRLGEAVFMQEAAFPVSAVRFPIVLGEDDYTRRLHFHIEHVRQGVPIGIPNPQALISFIRSDEAADFLYWLGQSDLTGPVNACSDGTAAIGDVISIIEEITGHKAKIVAETDEKDMSPFGIPESWYMDTTKARLAGCRFLSLAEWLPELVRTLNAAYEHKA
ncbi:NAD-dependent epimerase/dehydratase family protein [Paenibacillus terreus]|uniref:NAD-dependent epimerase/dehydratase family protein n=1 Tax=Paenibacillus terreus TaxID=1387834 RepID=A0ABV5B553_9BACL